MRDPYKIAIVGCGFISDAHIKAWRKNRCEVTSICDVSKDALLRFAAKHRVPKTYTDFEKMLQETEVDVIDVCTPPQTHKQLALKALDYGCHVFSEKPLALTFNDAKEIIERGKARGLKVWTTCNWIFMPSIIKAFSMISKGAIGELQSVDIIVYEDKKAIPNTPKGHWLRALPGGLFGETLPHPIYTLQYFIGKLKVLNKNLTKASDEADWMPYDELYALLKGEGALGSIRISYNESEFDVYIIANGSRGILIFNLFGKFFAKCSISKKWHKNVLHFSPYIRLLVDQVMGKLPSNAFEKNVEAFIKHIGKDEALPLDLSMVLNQIEVYQEILKKL
jgi:predicted dehydrogenase